MSTYRIDNSDNGDILRSILWQYEHAGNVIGVIELLKGFYDSSTKDFFDGLVERYNLADEDVGDFGLAVWGKILNLPRPYFGDAGMLGSGLYRLLLLGKIRLLGGVAAYGDDGNFGYDDYCELVFGGKAKVVNNQDMSITFEATGGAELTAQEQALLDNQDTLLPHPAGVLSNEHSNSLMFGLGGQQKVADSDPEIGGLDESSFCWRYTKNGNWIA